MTLESIYADLARVDALRDAVTAAENAGNDAEAERIYEEARKLHRTTCDSVSRRGAVYAEAVRFYTESRRRGNTAPDINRYPHADPAEIVSVYRENGIQELTISSTWTDAVQTIADFVAAGCKLTGIREVYIGAPSFRTNEYKKGPAVVLTIEEV